MSTIPYDKDRVGNVEKPELSHFGLGLSFPRRDSQSSPVDHIFRTCNSHEFTHIVKYEGKP